MDLSPATAMRRPTAVESHHSHDRRGPKRVANFAQKPNLRHPLNRSVSDRSWPSLPLPVLLCLANQAMIPITTLTRLARSQPKPDLAVRGQTVFALPPRDVRAGQIVWLRLPR